MEKILLPDSLRQQISRYESRLRLMETLFTVAAAAVGLLVSYLILFVLDRFFDTAKPLRLILSVSGGALAAWLVFHWSRHWIWQRRNSAQLSKLLQKHFRSLGDRLQGVVELANGAELPENISPALCRAAVNQVAEESKKYEFNKAVPMHKALRWVGAGAFLALLIGLPLVLTPPTLAKGIRDAAGNALERYAKPLSNIDRYTFAALDDLEPELAVAQGEPFQLSVSLKEDSVWMPATGLARIDKQPEINATFADRKAEYEFPGQTRDGTLKVKVGDAVRTVLVKPMPRPEIKSLEAIVQLPDYLGYPEETKPVTGTVLELLEGSKIGFRGQASRDLSQASSTSSLPNSFQPAVVEGAFFTVVPRISADWGSHVVLDWRDIHELAPVEPYQVSFTWSQDQPPQVEFLELEREIAVLRDEVLRFKLAAGDDFGVKKGWLTWSSFTTGADGVKELGKGEASAKEGSQREKTMTSDIEFSPKWFDIPEDTTVEIHANVVDYFPGREPVQSWKYVIHVLSKEKHAKRIQERMDDVFRQLDDRIRAEEGHLDENKNLQENKEALNSEKGAEDIKRLESSERGNEQMLGDITKEMGEIMKEALRNEEVPEKTLSEWSKQLEKLENEAMKAMKGAAESMKEASKPEAGEASEGGEPSEGEQPEGEKPEGEKPEGEKPEGEKPQGEKPEGEQPEGEKPKGQKPEGQKPSGEQPSGQPQQGKPQQSPPSQGEQKPSEREEKMKEAQEQQEKALQAMRDASQEMNAINEDLTARNFYNRLRRTAAIENEISGIVRKIAPDVLGLNPEEIQPKEKKDFDFAVSRQKENTEDVREIIKDLTGFLKRAEAPKHQAVRDEMEEKRAVPNLTDLSRMLGDNLAMRSISGTKEWGDQLDAWAEMLKDEAGGGGGEGQGEMDPDMMELAIKLLRTAKEEDNIRDQTKFLELTRPVSQDYEEETQFLSARQDQLADAVTELADTTKFQQVVPMLRQIDSLMRGVSSQLQTPRTDDEVVADQTAIIEQLLPPPTDQESQSQMQMPSSQLGQMQQMQRQMMQQMQSMTPGGNPSQSQSTKPNENTEGETGEGPNGARKIDKSGSAVDPSEWPDEYRDDLQKYFRNLDSASNP